MKNQPSSMVTGRRFRFLVGSFLCSVGLLLALAGLSESVNGTVATGLTPSASGTSTATGSMSTARSITGNTAAEFSGSGHLDDGTKVRLKGSVTNNGSSGTSDTISITFDNGYSVNGTLTSGDIRIY